MRRKKDQRVKTIVYHTVDVIFSDGKRLLFIRRAKEPFRNKLVLPGGHVETTDQDAVVAAQRETREEVGLKINADRFAFLCTLDSPDRDPRPGHRIARVYHVTLQPAELDRARAGSDAAEIVLHEMKKNLARDTVGFDHFNAIDHYYDYLGWLEMIEADDGWP